MSRLGIPFMGTVYHGSNQVFTAFEQSKARIKDDFFGGGVGYFTDSHPIGIQYAKSMSKGTGAPVLYTCTVNIKNMFDTETSFDGARVVALLPADVEGFARGSGLLKYGSDRLKVMVDLKSGKTSMLGKEIFKGLSGGMTSTAKARTHLRQLGFDGLRYLGGTITGAVKHWVYLPYSTSAIKIEDAALVDFIKKS